MKIVRMLLLLLTMLALTVTLAACGGGGEESADGGEVGGLLELAETYNADDGSITINYPSGWTVDGGLGILSAYNSDDPTVMTADEVPEGIVAAIIQTGPAENLGLAAGASVTDLAAAIPGIPEGTSASEITVGDFSAAEADIEVEGQTGYVLVAELADNQYAVVLVTADTRDTLNANKETLKAMIGSLSLGEAEAEGEG